MMFKGDLLRLPQVYSYAELAALVNENVTAYKAMILAGSTEISSLIATSAELLGAAPAAEAWLAYVANAESIILECLTEMLAASLKYLISQVEGQR